MVADELAGTQPAPLQFPPEAPRTESGEFSVIVRLRRENRRFLGLLLVGLPVARAGLVALVLVARRQWFSPGDLGADAGPLAGALASGDGGPAPARPVYSPDETQLRLESQFTMEATQERPQPTAAEARRKPVRRNGADNGGARSATGPRRPATPDSGGSSAQKGAAVAATPGPSRGAGSAAGRSAELALLARMERGRSELRLHVPKAAAGAAKPARSALAQPDVQRVLRGSRSAVTNCLNRELKRGGGFGNARRVVINFMVQPSGRTRKISLSRKVGNGYFQRCIVDVVSRMRFPAFSGAPQPVSYPLILTNSGF